MIVYVKVDISIFVEMHHEACDQSANISLKYNMNQVDFNKQYHYFHIHDKLKKNT
jgi:hypothetical protein